MAMPAPYLDGKIVQFKEKIMPKLIEQFHPQQVVFLGSGDISSALRDSNLHPIYISLRNLMVCSGWSAFLKVLRTLKNSCPDLVQIDG